MLKKYTETETHTGHVATEFFPNTVVTENDVLEGTKDQILEWLDMWMPSLDRNKVGSQELYGKCFFDSSSRFKDFRTQLDGLTKQDSILFYFYQHPIDPTKTYRVVAEDGLPEINIPQTHVVIKSIKVKITNN